MSAHTKLVWVGIPRLRLAQVEALQETADLAIAHTRSAHPGWHNRTGRAEASLKTGPIRQSATGVHIAIGFMGIPYGGKLEARGGALHRSVNSSARGLVSRIARRLRA